jgi:hypothetical protein
MTTRAIIVLALGLSACQSRPQPDTSGTAQGQSEPRLDTLAAPRVGASASAIQPPGAAAGTKTKGDASKPIPPVLQAPKGGEVTVGAVLDSPGLVSRVVRVTGRCLGYSTTRGAGPPPSSRSDWLLQSGGRTVYVVGAFPAGCSATSPSADDITISAQVAQDTLPGFAGRPGMPRRYLRIVK